MTIRTKGALLAMVILASISVYCNDNSNDNSAYPTKELRKTSLGNTTYYVHPVKGNDANDGKSKRTPWKTFKPVNSLILKSGDKVEVLAPGKCPVSLMPMGRGSKKKPIKICFAPGRYDFYDETAVKDLFHISNTNDAPKEAKAVALYLKDVENLKIDGRGADIYIHGRMIETCMIRCENISIQNINFDYHRPTMSEFTILEATDKSAVVSVHKDSTYKIKNDQLIWVGEGWEHNARGYSQKYDPKLDQVRRVGNVIGKVNRIEEVKPYKLRLHYTKHPGYKVGETYQFRYTRRDCVGVFMERSKDIVWNNVNLHFLHGMGVVSQFSENITFDHVNIAPRKGSGRTCAAWADMLHFSGCRGLIRVNKVNFSGANDDAINVHGTHLRVLKKVSPKQVLVRFMHGQSYGFKAFMPGDKIDFISVKTLVPYASNKVVKVDVKNARGILLSLKKEAPDNIEQDDVIENTTWAPDVHVTACRITRIPTRGFLLTTRGKVIIENNYFHRAPMSAILVADDARSWYESGVVRDMTIKGNTFFECGALSIHPENREAKEDNPVHKNIKIINNKFYGSGRIVSAKSTQGLTVASNQIYIPTNRNPEEVKTHLVHTNACSDIKVENNKVVKAENK